MRLNKILISNLIVLLLFSSCTKSATKKASFSEANISDLKAETPKKVEYLNPDVVKFNHIYSQMSERFKSEIKISEDKIEDFTNLLNKVILEDKDNLLLFNDKKHLLSESYEPVDLVPVKNCESFKVNRNDLSLRKSVYDGLVELGNAAKKEGITLSVSSTYRSYKYQAGLFARNVKELGLEAAERESARPGSSMHQLGVVVDFGSVTDDFAETSQCKWLNKNASAYGWTLSFPQGYEDVTGFRWESWQFRFVGKNAAILQKEYFNDVQQFMLEFIDLWKKN